MLGVCLKYTQHNYGSKLQALATVKMLEELDLGYEIIRYNKKTIGFLIKSIPRFFNFVFLNDRYEQIQQKLEFKRHPELKEYIDDRNNAFDSFDVNFNRKLSKVYSSYTDLKKKCSQSYNKVLTCSDQLWSPSALGSGFYNLMFVPEETLKVSWASSFGVSKIPWYQKTRTKRYLKRIQHISMRENRGSEIVKELTDRDVPVLMDPVFAFDKSQWNQLVPYSDSGFGDYIFCYFLGDNPEYRRAAEKLSAETGLKIVTLRHLDRYVASDENFGDFAPYDVSPTRFLNILRNASYICTDSFHGTAFSVIFEKNFVVFNRYSDSSANSKNSRIESVCKNLGLENRRYSDIESITELMKSPICYDNVSVKLEGYRKLTKQYLKNTLC